MKIVYDNINTDSVKKYRNNTLLVRAKLVEIVFLYNCKIIKIYSCSRYNKPNITKKPGCAGLGLSGKLGHDKKVMHAWAYRAILFQFIV
jgi:hypothetical protein